MTETDLTFANGDVTLAATLTWPETQGRVPIIIFVHGTGELDRDENHKLQKLDVFNTIADDLAKRGIASLRYDKRGCGKSTGTYITAGQSDLLGDLRAAINHVRTALSDKVSSVFLLGHSEGTLLAARASLTDPVDGLVLLTPFAQKLETILRAQALEGERTVRELPGFGGKVARFLTNIIGGPVQMQEKLIARVKSSTTPTIRLMLRKQPAKSFREWMELDPLEIYTKVKVPTLLLGGAKDLQCDPNDVAVLAKTVPGDVTSILMDDLTHILRRDPEEHSFNNYKKLLKQPMEPEVLQVVGDWLAERTGT